MNLTDREWRIVKMLTDGMKDQEIADRLNITYFRLKNYERELRDKLGLDNRLEIALWFTKFQHDHANSPLMLPVLEIGD